MIRVEVHTNGDEAAVLEWFYAWDYFGVLMRVF